MSAYSKKIRHDDHKTIYRIEITQDKGSLYYHHTFETNVKKEILLSELTDFIEELESEVTDG